MNNKAQKDSEICKDSVKMRIMNLLKPVNIGESSQEMENAILSILTQIVRDEPEYKIQIGKEFIDSAGKRIKILMQYMRYKKLQNYDLEKGKKPRKMAEFESISSNIVFDDVNEKKFFRLLIALCKNCDENVNKIKKIEEPLNEYLIDFVAGFCDQYKEEGNKRKNEHYTEIKENIRALSKYFD